MGSGDMLREDGGRAHGEAYEEFIGRVYLTAVRLGQPDRELLGHEGLSAEEIDVAMAELSARDLVVPRADGQSWEVAPPREAIARHTERLERRVAISRATATEVDAIWRRAMGTVPPAEALAIDPLTSVSDIADRVSGMHRVATSRLWCAFDASLATLLLLHRAQDRPELVRVPDGVEVRIVFDTALLEDDAAMAHLERSVAAGHGVRVGNGVPLTLVQCDRSALIDLSTFDDEGQGSIEVRRSPAVRAVGRILEGIWDLSTPYGPTMEAAGRQDGLRPPLDHRDQRVLHLLATGASDQLIARQLGVSVRTVERRVRYLTEHLGAATRFQAGVQAVRRGWL